MKTKTEKILVILKVLTYIAFIGLSIECGSQIVAFFLSFKNPEIASRFYAVNQSIFGLMRFKQWYFVSAMSLVVAISMINATIWLNLIQLFSKLNLMNPFSNEVVKKVEIISYQLFGIWILSIVAEKYFGWLTKVTGLTLTGSGIGGEYLLLAGIVYIISQIFRRGIEIQEENQLTI